MNFKKTESKRLLFIVLVAVIICVCAAIMATANSRTTAAKASEAETTNAVSTYQLETDGVFNYQFGTIPNETTNQQGYTVMGFASGVNMPVANIPAMFNNFPVLAIGPGVFANKPLTSVVAPSIHTIYENAFSMCSQLQNAVFSPQRMYIGGQAFFGTNNLRLQNLNARYVGYNAFMNCTINSLQISGTNMFNSVEINPNAFANCSINSLRITGSGMSNSINISQNAFNTCTIMDFDITGNNVTIGQQAFNNCAIAQFDIAGVGNVIARDAFNQCDINFFKMNGQNCTFEWDAFKNCTFIEIILSGINNFYNDSFTNCTINMVLMHFNQQSMSVGIIFSDVTVTEIISIVGNPNVSTIFPFVGLTFLGHSITVANFNTLDIILDDIHIVDNFNNTFAMRNISTVNVHCNAPLSVDTFYFESCENINFNGDGAVNIKTLRFYFCGTINNFLGNFSQGQIDNLIFDNCNYVEFTENQSQRWLLNIGDIRFDNCDYVKFNQNALSEVYSNIIKFNDCGEVVFEENSLSVDFLFQFEFERCGSVIFEEGAAAAVNNIDYLTFTDCVTVWFDIGSFSGVEIGDLNITNCTYLDFDESSFELSKIIALRINNVENINFFDFCFADAEIELMEITSTSNLTFKPDMFSYATIGELNIDSAKSISFSGYAFDSSVIGVIRMTNSEGIANAIIDVGSNAFTYAEIPEIYIDGYNRITFRRGSLDNCGDVYVQIANSGRPPSTANAASGNTNVVFDVI